MSMPFYVSPEQVMKDRADYARKGIARGRSLVALECAAGVLIVADNASRTLSKISEIYDRIAFAAVGKYNEFQMLRVAGVRHADLKGYSYSREDVIGEGARQRVRADARPGVHPRDEAVRGRAARRRGRPRRRRPRRDVPRASTTASSWTSSDYSVLGGQAEQITEALEGAVRRRHGARRRAQARRAGARRRRRRRSAPTSSRSRCSNGPARAARSAASRTTSSTDAARLTPSALSTSAAPARSGPRSARTGSSARDHARPRDAARDRGRRPIVVEELVGFVDLGRRAAPCSLRRSGRSGTYTSTRAISPTVSPYGPSSAPRSSTSKPSSIEPGRQHVRPKRSLHRGEPGHRDHGASV